MNASSSENQFESLFSNIQVRPGDRFYRRMKKAAWTPAGVARRRSAAMAGITVLLLSALLAFTPQGRAWAQAVIHFFTRTSGDTLPVPTAAPLVWVDVTPGVPVSTATSRALFSDCGDFGSPKCSVEQIRLKVNFQVRELGTVPPGMNFMGATGDPGRIALLYGNGPLTYGLSLMEEPWNGSSEMTKWQIGASAVVETVQIGDVSGEYVKGGFKTRLLQPPTFNDVHFNQVWDDNVGQEALHWVKDGIFYSMSAWDNDMDNVLPEKDAFVALAAGLTTEPVSAGQTFVSPTATSMPVITFEGQTYDLSVAQAKAQAGFAVLEPGKLPNVLSLAGAAYEPQQKIVRIFYVEPPLDPFLTFGLRLSQQPAPNAADCSLCSLKTGNYADALNQKDSLVIAADTKVETLQIGNGTGQYFEGEWGPVQFKWLPYNSIKTLLWQANGMAFELKYFGYMTASGEVPISQADLIAIAESIK